MELHVVMGRERCAAKGRVRATDGVELEVGEAVGDGVELEYREARASRDGKGSRTVIG